MDKDEIRKLLLKKSKVVKVKAELLDQNDLYMEWRMAHLALTKEINPRSHTQNSITFQDEMCIHLLMIGQEVHFPLMVLNLIMELV